MPPLFTVQYRGAIYGIFILPRQRLKKSLKRGEKKGREEESDRQGEGKETERGQGKEREIRGE